LVSFGVWLSYIQLSYRNLTACSGNIYRLITELDCASRIKTMQKECREISTEFSKEVNTDRVRKTDYWMRTRNRLSKNKILIFLKKGYKFL
jgi:hypothetical protein